MDDYSYLGDNGHIYVREYGALAPLVEVGNCSALNLSPQEDTKTLLNHTEPGGGTQNETTRVSGVELSYTFHDFSPDNLARALRGTATTVAGGAVVDEAAVGYAGGFVKLAKIPSVSTIVVKNTAGTTTYVAGVDYEARAGGVYILPATTVPAPVAGAANLKISYTAVAQKKIQALVLPDKKYEIVFTGLNQARSGKAAVIQCFKVNHGVMSQFAAIGQEYGAGEVNGKLMIDTTKSGVGVSKYFTVELED